MILNLRSLFVLATELEHHFTKFCTVPQPFRETKIVLTETGLSPQSFKTDRSGSGRRVALKA